MKDLNNYRKISNKELQEIKGGFGAGVSTLFMAIPLGKISRKSLARSC